jgi:Flp pilus assembly protein TadG
MKCKIGHRITAEKKGANVVEFALVLFILMLLLAAIADLGRAFTHYIVITNAAREGARLGGRAEHSEVIDDWIIEAVVREAANSNIDLTEAGVAEITIEPAIADREEGEPITVTVEYTLSMMLGGFVGLQELPMRSQTVMMMFGSEQVTVDPPAP